MQGMNNNGVDKEDKEEKAGLTLEQFTDIVLAQVSFHGMSYFYSDLKKLHTSTQTFWDILNGSSCICKKSHF